MCVNLFHNLSDKNPKPGVASLWTSSLNAGGCLTELDSQATIAYDWTTREAEAGWSLGLAYSLGSQISDSFSKTK